MKPSRSVVRIAAVVCWLGVDAAWEPLRAVEREDILFYASMDGTTDARTARGPKRGAVEGRTSYEPGRRGQALVCGEAGAVCRYQTQDNLDPARGTIEMWVKLVDWEPSDQNSRVWTNGTTIRAGACRT